MEIEEIKEGYYTKKSSEKEREIVDKVNRFLEKQGVASDSVEGVVAEVLKRIRPLIATLVRSAMVFESRELIQEAVNEILTASTNKLYEYAPISTTNTISVSSFRIPEASTMCLYINGKIQAPSTYTLETSDGYISLITLNSDITIEDTVVILSLPRLRGEDL